MANSQTISTPVWRAHNTSTSSLRRPRILIVDDSNVFRRQLSVWLNAAGFNVSCAVDGQEGLELLSSGRFDLALVDHNMPRMGGVEMIEALRATWKKNGQTAAKNPVRLVMLTSENDASLVLRAKAAGVDGWIFKPSKEELVVMAVKKLTGFGIDKPAS